MESFRRESWGRLVYDADTDEFEAHVRSSESQVLIDRPVSAGCIVTDTATWLVVSVMAMLKRFRHGKSP
jgi:hypothetical protein